MTGASVTSAQDFAEAPYIVFTMHADTEATGEAEPEPEQGGGWRMRR